MDVRAISSKIRMGRFLWLDEKAQKSYLLGLNKKIAEGYFTSDQILTRIVDEMAPVFNDSVEDDHSN